MGPGFFSGKEEKPKAGLSEYRWTHTDVVSAKHGNAYQEKWAKLVGKCLGGSNQAGYRLPTVPVDGTAVFNPGRARLEFADGQVVNMEAGEKDQDNFRPG